MPVVELRLVGRLRVLVDGRELPTRDVGTRKARALLERLGAARGDAVPAEVLADAVWGDAPPHSPGDNLATLVSRLRSALGHDVVTGDRSGWRLGSAVRVDLDEATGLLARADAARTRHEPAVAAAAALAAVRLLAGDVLADEPSAPWADDVREQSAAVLRRARGVAAEASLDAGDPSTAASVATDAVRADPYDETAVRFLMRAHRAAGEPGRALAAYERLRRLLAHELGAYPAPGTRALHVELLNETEPAAAATAATAAPSMTAGPDRIDLVGREPECERITARWAEAVAGRPGLLLVTGEPGIGKTRLTEELAELARSTGGTVLSARCYETEHSLFLQPLVDALRPELLRSSAATLRELAGDRAASLAPLVPEVAALLGPFAAEHRSPDTERRLAYEAVATVLRRLSAHGPVLLLLDDLHNAGLATVEQLHLLARTAGSEPLLVAATLRTAEGAEAVRRLEPVAEQLALGRLPDEAVLALAARAGRPELGESIARRTRGHALSVVETLRALSAGETGVPATLAAAVLARVGRLAESEQELVRAACVLGSSFEPVTVAALLSVPTAAAVRGSAVLVDAGLVVVAGRAYEFANDLVQEVLYASTPEPTRYAYHRIAMDLLADRPEASAGHAVACGQPERAAQAWLHAADAAAARFAAADAERILGFALDAANACGDEGLVAQVQLARGRQRETLGSYAAAVADFTAALDLSRRNGMAELQMQVHKALAGDAPVALGRPLGSCLPHLHEGLAIAERLGDDAMAAELLARLAILWCNRLDFVAGREHGLAAVAAGRRSGDPVALRHGLDGLKTTYAYVGDLAGLTEVAAELERLARRAGDLFLLQWVVFEQAFVPLAAGDWDRAAALVEEATALTRRSGRLKYEGWLLAHLGWIARLAGRTDDAIGQGRRSVAAVPPDGHSWFGATANAMLATTLLQTGADGHRDEAVRLLRSGLVAADRSGAEGYRLRCMAPLAEATGSPDVLRQADRILAGARFPEGFAWLAGADAYLSLGRAWLAAGEPERAAAVVQKLVDAGEDAGWSAFVRAGGAYELLDRCGRSGHSSAESRAATRSAPSRGTGR